MDKLIQGYILKFWQEKAFLLCRKRGEGKKDRESIKGKEKEEKMEGKEGTMEGKEGKMEGKEGKMEGKEGR